MTANLISGLAGSALSLIFSYLPGAAPWFDKLTPTQRRLFMAALMLAVAGAAFVYTCQAQQVCLVAGWQDYLTAYAAALVANQTTYSVSPQPAPKIEAFPLEHSTKGDLRDLAQIDSAPKG